MKIDYSLYLVTDRALMSTEKIEDSVELALKGGCTIIQLREKDVSSKEFYELACRVKKIASHYDVPLLINDRVDIALAIDADGVHVGQSDLPVNTVRALIGKDKILGVSASNIKDAKDAEASGADYLGVGAMFSTATKTDATPVSFDELSKIRASANIPIVAIGGINASKIPLFPSRSVDGFAIVSAIVAQPDIEKAAVDLMRLIEEWKTRS